MKTLLCIQGIQIPDLMCCSLLSPSIIPLQITYPLPPPLLAFLTLLVLPTATYESAKSKGKLPRPKITLEGVEVGRKVLGMRLAEYATTLEVSSRSRSFSRRKLLAYRSVTEPCFVAFVTSKARPPTPRLAFPSRTTQRGRCRSSRGEERPSRMSQASGSRGIATEGGGSCWWT